MRTVVPPAGRTALSVTLLAVPLLAVSLAAALLVLCAAPASAQQADDGEATAIRAVVDRLFDAMRERDTASLGSAFHNEARLYGLAPDGAVRVTSAAEFVESVANAPEGLLLDEVIDDVEIRIDGALATVWTYYDFFAGDNFSHCGYNAFQMLRTDGGWKVVAVTDSRRREDCRQQRTPGGS